MVREETGSGGGEPARPSTSVQIRQKEITEREQNGLLRRRAESNRPGHEARDECNSLGRQEGCQELKCPRREARDNYM